MIRVNGENIEGAEGKNLKEFLQEAGYDITKLAVEMNGDIIPKANYAKTLLGEGDSLEVVRFVGGGWLLLLLNKNLIKQWIVDFQKKYIKN